MASSRLVPNLSEREPLPAEAFALPARRLFPIYRRSGGRLEPDAHAARTALGLLTRFEADQKLPAHEIATVRSRAAAVIASAKLPPQHSTSLRYLPTLDRWMFLKGRAPVRIGKSTLTFATRAAAEHAAAGQQLRVDESGLVSQADVK